MPLEVGQDKRPDGEKTGDARQESKPAPLDLDEVRGLSLTPAFQERRSSSPSWELSGCESAIWMPGSDAAPWLKGM